MGGVDKPLLRLRGRPVLDHILRGLRPQVGRIALNANGSPERFAAWDIPVLPDPVRDAWPDRPGPLAGILAAMVWASPFASHVLSWPGDTPYPPADLVVQLMRAAAGSEAVVCAASAGRRHPTIAVWPVKLADALRATLTQGAFRVSAFADRYGCQVVAWNAEPDPFFNLNTPADLADAERRG